MIDLSSPGSLCEVCRDQERFGVVLKRNRERKRMKAYVLADLCALADHSTLSKWESGEQLPRDPRVIGHLIDNLQLSGESVEYLFAAWICEKLCGNAGQNCCSEETA